MQTTMIDTAVRGKDQPFLLKDGSLTDEDFYRIHKGENPVHFSLILEKIASCKMELLNTGDLDALEESLLLSPQGISLAWIKPECLPKVVISTSAEKAVHVGSRESPWVIPVSVFRTDAFEKLKQIYPYCDSTDLFGRMTVQSISKFNGISFAKVGI